jgi:uncharacterized protein YbcV (DUF1398 family)
MFTIQQIEQSHEKVKSGAEFPAYIQEIKQLGVLLSFETWVSNSHTVYFGSNGFQTQSLPKYDNLEISSQLKKEKFKNYLKIHQEGQTDYFTFCKHCAETGIEKWIVDLTNMTCTYYHITGITVLLENIPS